MTATVRPAIWELFDRARRMQRRGSNNSPWDAHPWKLFDRARSMQRRESNNFEVGEVVA